MPANQSFVPFPRGRWLSLALSLLATPIFCAALIVAPAAQAETAAVRQGYTLLSQDRVNDAINAFRAILRQIRLTLRLSWALGLPTAGLAAAAMPLRPISGCWS